MGIVVTPVSNIRGPKKHLFFGLFLLLAPVSSVFAIEEVEQARTLLKKMASANRELNYQGTFTYEYAGALKAVRITHALVDGLEYERLLYLNGPKRVIQRGGKSPECRRSSDEFFLAAPVPSAIGNLESTYELYLRGEDRIADRPVRVLHVVPRDALRYGYILSIDKETGLLLQSLVVGGNRRVMERFQYVSITLGSDDTDVATIVASVDGSAEGSVCADSAPVDTGWQAEWLPDGFQLVGSSLENGEISMSYSDGMSFLSVFVSKDGTPLFPPIQAQRGATVAQIARQTHNGREYAVCVVGEIPPETAERIAQFVRPTL